VTTHKRIDAFNEVLAERIEQRVQQLTQAGAAEDDVRALIRDSIDFARGQQ
jgi:hypothetical protein